MGVHWANVGIANETRGQMYWQLTQMPWISKSSLLTFYVSVYLESVNNQNIFLRGIKRVGGSPWLMKIWHTDFSWRGNRPSNFEFRSFPGVTYVDVWCLRCWTTVVSSQATTDGEDMWRVLSVCCCWARKSSRLGVWNAFFDMIFLQLAFWNITPSWVGQCTCVKSSE